MRRSVFFFFAVLRLIATLCSRLFERYGAGLCRETFIFLGRFSGVGQRLWRFFFRLFTVELIIFEVKEDTNLLRSSKISTGIKGSTIFKDFFNSDSLLVKTDYVLRDKLFRNNNLIQISTEKTTQNSWLRYEEFL